MNDLITVGEVADLLGTCRATVRRHTKSGALPVIAINARLHRYRRADVLAFLDRHRRSGPDAV